MLTCPSKYCSANAHVVYSRLISSTYRHISHHDYVRSMKIFDEQMLFFHFCQEAHHVLYKNECCARPVFA